MVRVGGGWEPLEEFLRKHDPCRGWPGRIHPHFFLVYQLVYIMKKSSKVLLTTAVV